MGRALMTLLFQHFKHITGERVFCFININDQTDSLNRISTLTVTK